MANKIYAKIKNYIKENYKFLIGVILIITFFNIDEFLICLCYAYFREWALGSIQKTYYVMELKL